MGFFGVCKVWNGVMHVGWSFQSHKIYFMSVEIRMKPNINVGISGSSRKWSSINYPKTTDWNVETKYRIAFTFPNNGDRSKVMWTVYDCAEWTKIRSGMFASWRSDVSHSSAGNGPEGSVNSKTVFSILSANVDTYEKDTARNWKIVTENCKCVWGKMESLALRYFFDITAMKRSNSLFILKVWCMASLRIWRCSQKQHSAFLCERLEGRN